MIVAYSSNSNVIKWMFNKDNKNLLRFMAELTMAIIFLPTFGVKFSLENYDSGG